MDSKVLTVLLVAVSCPRHLQLEPELELDWGFGMEQLLELERKPDSEFESKAELQPQLTSCL
jgi:hypothetical protein